jgi:hypothetical protein
VRIAIAIVGLCAMTAISASLACQARCNDFCNESGPVDILEVNNLLVSSVTSSCNNVELSGNEVIGNLLDKPATCHVEIFVSDGEHFAFDIPFTVQPATCCGTTPTGFTASWNTVMVGFPSLDASPFPPTDASDATPPTDASDATDDVANDASDAAD